MPKQGSLPNISWIIPANTTAVKNAVQEPPNEAIDVKTITAKPAAGPLTPNGEPLATPTTIPPTIPAIIPANRGAPDAKAMPKQSGTATKNTTILAGRSLLISLNILFISIFNFVLIFRCCKDSDCFLNSSNTSINDCKNFVKNNILS